MLYSWHIIGNRIRENRKEKGLSQERLACEIFDCDMSYLLCECNTKHFKTQEIGSATGLSDKAIDTLISLCKIDSRLSDTISRIIENKDLLYQIHDCCTGKYNNADFETLYEDSFSGQKRKPSCLHRK